MKAFICVLTLVSTLTVSQAQNFLAHLDGLQDGGGTRTGTGTINLTLTGTTITFSGSFSGLSGTVANFHIHGPGAPGVAANVMYGFLSTITLGADQKSGTMSGTQTLVAGTLGFDIPTQLSQLNGGLWYFNIHSSTFSGGEIRGQILPVPEPTTWALGGLGLFGLLMWKRRK